MNKRVLFLSLAFTCVLALSGLLAFKSANAQGGKPTTLMTKDLPDVPGKEGMMEIVEFAPGEVSQPHRHNADVFVYVLEGSIITQLKGASSQTVSAGDVFYESPTDIHSVTRNASDKLSAKILVFYVKKKGAPEIEFLKEGTSNGSGRYSSHHFLNPASVAINERLMVSVISVVF
jgi:quercetin dioxygenase-like cupin family protein